MKKSFYLFTMICFAFIMFMTAPAKANDRDDDRDRHNQPSSNKNTALPINKNIVFLIIAGLVIGVVAVNKTKTTAAKL